MQFDDARIARLYRNVPQRELQRLLRFRATYVPQSMNIDGIVWEYIDAGQGDTTLLILPGGLKLAESAWMTISYFAEEAAGGPYRVVAPSYPASVATMTGLVDGIAKLLEQLRIGKVEVIGSSYGGMVAQLFVRRHPDRADKVILSHTTTPDAARGRRIARALPWLRLLPMWALRPLVKRALLALLPEDEKLTFFEAYLAELLRHRQTKEGLLNGYRQSIEFDLNTVFTPEDLARWSGTIYLILADDDPVTPASSRAKLRALYPGARVYEFHGTGHATALLAQGKYWALLESYLSEPQVP